MESAVGIEIDPVDDPRAVMRGADVILAATSSIDPVIRGKWLEPGMQVTAINECADQEAIRRMELFARTGGGQPQNFYCGELVGGKPHKRWKHHRVSIAGDSSWRSYIWPFSRLQLVTTTSFGFTGGEGSRGIQFAAAGTYVYQERHARMGLAAKSTLSGSNCIGDS